MSFQYIQIDNKEEVLTRQGKVQVKEKNIVVYWQTEIAKKCGLTYGDVSRYGKECGYGKAVGRKQSQSNEEFVRQLDEILGNYDPTNKVWD